jgi:hypothetical protein
LRASIYILSIVGALAETMRSEQRVSSNYRRSVEEITPQSTNSDRISNVFRPTR